MTKLPDERQIYDLVSVIEENTSLNIYLSEVPLLLKSREGTYYGYYAFTSEVAFRLEYSGQDLIGFSYWDAIGSLNEASLRVNLKDLDISQSQSIITNLLNAMPSDEDNAEDFNEVTKFISHIGEFIKNKGASYAYDSYEIWADTNSDSPLTKQDFYTTFNKVVNQKDNDMTSKIESPIQGETVVLAEVASESFVSKVIKNEDSYSYRMLESALKCMASDSSDINAIFICGEEVDSARSLVKEIFQEEDVWNSKVLWKSKTTSIYQFLTSLWTHRKGAILVFDNVDAPLKRKDHNFNMLLDEVMKTETPNRIVSYSRKGKAK